MAEFRIETERLILRDWHDADIDPFHAICSDPVVMATLGPLMTRDQVVALIQRLQKLQSMLGHCFWAMERKDDQTLIGWCGVIRGAQGTPIAGKAEAGWRLASSAWGNGFATEAATASIQWLFDQRDDDSVWAITSVANGASRAVMERLGMEYLPELDFNHPNVPADSPLLCHVTYRMEYDLWQRNRAAG